MDKKILAALSFIILVSVGAIYASGIDSEINDGWRGPGPGTWMGKPFRHLEILQYQIDLTNAQVDKIYKIDRTYEEKFFQNRKDFDKLNELRYKHDVEIESVLTAEQKVKWYNFRNYHPINRGNRGNIWQNFGRPGGFPGHDNMRNNFSLTDEQIDKIHKIRMDYSDKFYKNRNDGDMVRELRVKQDAEIGNILTADQKIKWQEFKENWPMHNRPYEGRGHRHHHRYGDDMW